MNAFCTTSTTACQVLVSGFFKLAGQIHLGSYLLRLRVLEYVRGRADRRLIRLM